MVELRRDALVPEDFPHLTDARRRVVLGLLQPTVWRRAIGQQVFTERYGEGEKLAFGQLRIRTTEVVRLKTLGLGITRTE
jgi:hypothetical protein